MDKPNTESAAQNNFLSSVLHPAAVGQTSFIQQIQSVTSDGTHEEVKDGPVTTCQHLVRRQHLKLQQLHHKQSQVTLHGPKAN